ncbi:uncharacterized protein EV420DRAFT_1514141 [Desarmillaria tabescens]|uniref:GST N-terminal domain-containing protein n=1 Tax=Armillaria tabescens TaxID=1929756 RepID=A0AA39U1V1_ARMTA|nr:uncharacterized protein EV420DRAFT_1514141 [Desarmillaria tabescens]KAK0465390.1 hypothetical protein EV420DRAFT_1514141 [Desarmillaria tabescens]
MSPTLYTFGGSVWSAAPELAVAELYLADAIATKTINLVNGENFDPAFIDINPSATLPTLTAGGKTYQSTADVISYLVAHAPKPLSTPASHKAIIDQVHEDQYDPNFALLLVRDESERATKAAALPKTFVENRQNALLKHSQDPANSRHAAFYNEKLAGNGALLDIYTGANKDPADFYAQSQAHFDSLKTYLYTVLPTVLPAEGFIAGATPGEADFHIAAWLTRIAATSGAISAADATESLEKNFGAPLPESVRSYARAWIARDSWKKVYAEGLH